MKLGCSIDIGGQRFGRLRAETRDHASVKKTRWFCVCDCGRTVSVRADALRAGKAQSCGCLHAEIFPHIGLKHGMSRTKLYRSWVNMHSRCSLAYPTHKYWHAKGVTVCDAWSDFVQFSEWALAHGYRAGLSLDRIESSKGYGPDNCEWVTLAENGRRASVGRWSGQVVHE